MIETRLVFYKPCCLLMIRHTAEFHRGQVGSRGHLSHPASTKQAARLSVKTTDDRWRYIVTLNKFKC